MSLSWLACESCSFLQKVPQGLSPEAAPGAWLALGVHLGHHASECGYRVYDHPGPGKGDVPVAERTFLDEALERDVLAPLGREGGAS